MRNSCSMDWTTFLAVPYSVIVWCVNSENRIQLLFSCTIEHFLTPLLCVMSIWSIQTVVKMTLCNKTVMHRMQKFSITSKDPQAFCEHANSCKSCWYHISYLLLFKERAAVCGCYSYYKYILLKLHAGVSRETFVWWF